MTRRHPQTVAAIRDRSTFRAFHRPHGRGARGPVSAAYLLPAPHVPAGVGVRVGYAIGRGCGNAVRRNRLRRRFRDAVRRCAGTLPAGSYLVRAGPGAAELPHRPLVEAVSGAMSDAARAAGARADGTGEKAKGPAIAAERPR